jgi:predicted DNA-binding WGR domain protein
MKLIQRTTLLYQEGNSDKVYEVDLCQTSEDLYVVNFRYGRRGTNLKEGVKTAQPVPEAQAQKVFDELVLQRSRRAIVMSVSRIAMMPRHPNLLKQQLYPSQTTHAIKRF